MQQEFRNGAPYSLRCVCEKEYVNVAKIERLFLTIPKLLYIYFAKVLELGKHCGKVEIYFERY